LYKCQNIAKTNCETELPEGDFIFNMKATGIVRRIDDLGRVVIPKEIRRTMRIREGDPLEIYTDIDGEVIFKKYSPMGELQSFASQYAETLYKTCSMSVVICDKDTVISCAGVQRKEYIEKKLSADFEKLFESRNVYKQQGNSKKIYVVDEEKNHYVSCAMPIINDGDIVGCVASLKANDGDTNEISSDIEQNLIVTAASFLGKQI
jgi:AbrB family transcriptional regulator (stage V sporulation protein T)